MSSSVSTNVGPREGGPERDVSQIFDSASGQSSTGPYTLPLTGNLNKTVSVDTKKRLVRKLMYPKLCDKMEKAGFKYELSLEEQSLTMLYENAATITSRISTVVRQVHKGKEYLVSILIYLEYRNDILGWGLWSPNRQSLPSNLLS